MSQSSRGFKKVFFWTFGILLVLIAGLIVLSIGGSDRPFSYLGF